MADKLKVGISGSGGFIGRRLASFLESRNLDIARFNGNMLDQEKLSSYFLENPDLSVFIHLAGCFSGSDSDIFSSNTLTSINLATSICSTKELRVIFTSSGAVYGNTGASPVSEVSKLTPNTQYGFAKKWAEEYLAYSLAQKSIGLVALRLPSVYGPGNSKGVIYNWIESIGEASTITLNGDGRQLRSFLHIEDLVDVINRFISHPVTGIYNVAGSENLSLRDLVRVFSTYMEFDVICEPSNNQLQSMVISIDKLCSTLEWSPKYSVEDYIKSHC